MNCTVSGNKLIVTSDTAPSDVVTITATRDQKRSGVIVWTDGQHRSGGVQDTVTYSASVSDPVKAYVNLKVSCGSAKIIKTSEDGKVDGISFSVHCLTALISLLCRTVVLQRMKCFAEERWNSPGLLIPTVPVLYTEEDSLVKPLFFSARKAGA